MILKGDHYPAEENIQDSNSRQYLDEMSESTIHSPDDNTVQLSLPDSFDETLTVNGIQIIENLQKESQQEHVHANKAILRISSNNESSRIKSDWIEEEKKRIFSLAESSSDLMGGLEYNYDRLKFLPKDRMTILDAAALAVQTKVTKLSGTHRQEVNRLRDQIECLEHELGEVKRSKKALAQRFESLESELLVSNGGKQELNSKLRELHDQILQYKVMERDFEATKLKFKATEDEKDGFHRQLELKEKNLNEATSAGRESMQKLAESERKVQSMISEKVLLQKETDLILERAERLEKDFHQSEARLSAIRNEYEDAMRKAKSAEEKARADWETKLASEMSRVRQESSNDVSQLFKHRIDVWERENTLLRESKKDLQKELEQLKRELIGARETYDTQLAQNIKTLSEKEHEIVELRSQLTIKSFEVSNLVSTQDTLSAEQKKLMLQNEHLRHQLSTHEKEFIKLEHECKAEQKKLLDELERTREQLNVYLQAEMQAEMEINAGKDPGKVAQSSDPRRRVQHCLDLARKVGELQKIEETLRQDVGNLRKENDQLQAMKKSYEQLVNYANQPSGSILATLKEKTYENQQLKSELQKYKEEMQKMTSHREKFKKEVSSFVQKRKKLEEMVKAFQDLQTCSKTTVEKGFNFENNDSEFLATKKMSAEKRMMNAVGAREHDISSLQSCTTGMRANDMSVHLIHQKDHRDAGLRR